MQDAVACILHFSKNSSLNVFYYVLFTDGCDNVLIIQRGIV